MEITLYNEQSEIELTGETREAVAAALDVLEAQGSLPLAATLLLTDDEEIARLNAEFRGMERPTDVLSFPAYELEGRLLEEQKDELALEWADGRVFIGDIAISMARAAEQAEQYGHSLRREVAFLAVHGALHLLGYDHVDGAGERAMNEMQEKVLGAAGIGR